MSKHPPTRPCFAIFRGYRRSGRQTVEVLNEPVEIVEIVVGSRKELAVAMTGRATKWAMDRFDGIWQLIDLGE